MADQGRRAACQRVYQRFPELAGAKPTVEHRGTVRVFTFSRDVPVGSGGPGLRQIVRVTVDAGDTVVKIAVSR